MITVTGSLAFDYIMDFNGIFADHIMPDKIHKLNLSFYLETLNKQRGGNAGNISYTLSLLKQPVSILSAAGKDFAEYAKFLKDAGVITSYIKIIENEPTASAFMMTDKNDNQISGFYPGAIKQTNTLSVKSLNPKPDLMVISPDNPDSMIIFCHECQQLNIPYLFDPGMQLPTLSDEQLIQGIKGAEILIGNDYEMALLCDKLQVTSDKLLENAEILITTFGNKGSVIKTKNQSIEIKAAKIEKIIDPTGAGDAYRAGFLAGYMKKMDLKICGQMGSVAAMFAIEKYGTSNHTFTVAEFCQRYKQNFGDELKL